MRQKVLFLYFVLFCLLFPPGVTGAATATYNWANQNNTHWMTLRYTTDGGSGEAWERLAANTQGNNLLVSYDPATANTDVAVFEIPLNSLGLDVNTRANAVIDSISLSFNVGSADSPAVGAPAAVYRSSLNPSEEADNQLLYNALNDTELVAEDNGGPLLEPNSPTEISIPWDGIAGSLQDALNDTNASYYSVALIITGINDPTTNNIDTTQGATLSIDYHISPPVLSSLTVSTSSINVASAGSYLYATSTFDRGMSTTTAPTLTFSPNVVSSGTLTFSSGAWSSGDTVYAARYTIANVGEEKTGVDIAVSGAVASAGNGGATMTATTSADRFNVDTIAPATPSASPDAGTYSSAQSVTLSSTGSNTIRYTTDGTTPTCSTGTLYSGAISVSSSLTIKALGCDTAGNTPALATLAYTIDSSSGVSGSSGGHRSFSSDASNNGDAAGDDQQDSGDPVAFNDAGEPLGESGVLELVPGESPVRVPVTELLNTPTVRLTLEEVVRKVLMLITLFLNIKL